MKCLTVVGARPQFIKAAVISYCLRSNEQREILVHTGQHYDRNMSEVFFDELEISQPDYHLGIGSGFHGSQTGQMLESIEKVLLDEKPTLVLVYGDTNSTLAGALAATKLHIPVAHVEAGLRSFNRVMPEEINRVLTDHISDLHFAPTTTAVENLLREGIPKASIHLTGDVMYDSALYYGTKAEAQSHVLETQGLVSKDYILATFHRAENTDCSERLLSILEGLMIVSEEIPVVVPLHPRTRNALLRENLFLRVSQVLQLIEPVGYLDMLMLEKNACLIATDSGGVQKEAFFYEVPCITLRKETEWVELVKLGWNYICDPTSAEAVANSVSCTLGVVGHPDKPYGEGKAATQIVNQLIALGKMLSCH